MYSIEWPLGSVEWSFGYFEIAIVVIDRAYQFASDPDWIAAIESLVELPANSNRTIGCRWSRVVARVDSKITGRLRSE